MKSKLIGLGAGGHAKVLIEALRERDEWVLVGLLDSNPKLAHQSLLGVPVLGGDDLMPQLFSQGVSHFFVGVGSASGTSDRQRLFHLAVSHALQAVSIVHPRAWVSPSAEISRGTCILAGAIVNADARVGENVILNSAAVVEHDCHISAHAHVATGACLAGGVFVGEGSHIGVGAVVRQGIRIGRNSVVGAGAVVVADVPDNVVVAGVPARILREQRA